MTKDDDLLLRKLGALADEQREAPLPPELQTPLGDAFEQSALAALFPTPNAPSEVVPLRRRSAWARRLRVGVPVALAASLLMFVVRTATNPPDVVPVFAMEVSGAVANLRSEQTLEQNQEGTAAPLELASDTELEVVLRPERPGDAEMAASLFVIRESQTQRLSLKPDRSPDGAFRFVVPGDLLLSTGGNATLVAWVGLREDAKESSNDVPSSGQRFTRALLRR